MEQKHGLKQRPVDKKGPNRALLLPSSDLQAKLQGFKRNQLRLFFPKVLSSKCHYIGDKKRIGLKIRGFGLQRDHGCTEYTRMLQRLQDRKGRT